MENQYQKDRGSMPQERRLAKEHALVASGDYLRIASYIEGLLNLMAADLGLSAPDAEDFKAAAREILGDVILRYRERFLDSDTMPDFLFSTYFATHLEALVERHVGGGAQN